MTKSPMPIDTHIRFPGSTRGVTLEGTLTLPDRDAPSTVVLLLSGSGPQDRDQTVAGQATFRALRFRLAEAGHAAASWDDRGVGGSTGGFQESTSDELVADVRCCLEYLRAHLSPLPRVVLLGHSQGALIAARATVENAGVVRGLALIAGAGRPGLDVLVDQHRRICQAEGWSDEEAEGLLAFKLRCFRVLETYPERLDADQRTKLEAALEDIAVDHFGVEGPVAEIVEDLLEWEWRFILRMAPAEILAAVPVPTCLCIGSKDTQVNPRKDLDGALHALRSGRCPRIDVLDAPGLNHLFQRAGTGGLDEYEDLGEPFDPLVTDQLAAWLARIVE